MKRTYYPARLFSSGLALALIVILLTPDVASSQAGSLDPTFGDGGLATFKLDGRSPSIASTVIQTDGKIVMAGFDSPGFVLARCNSDGTLDADFGAGGAVTTDFGLRANSVVLQDDGKIVAAGSASGDFAVARFNSDGTLDSGFGTAGLVTTDIGRSAWSVAIQADGKIVASGSGGVLARYNADGTLDAGFGTGGLVTDRFGVSSSSVAIQADGKIVVDGRGGVVVRYNADGTLDSGFGMDGFATSEISRSAGDRVMAIQADGKIVVAGASSSGGTSINYFHVIRFRADGALDASFGVDGTASAVMVVSGETVARSLVLQDDGKIIVIGRVDVGAPSNSYDFGLARFNSDGSLDTSFDGDGTVVTDLKIGGFSNDQPCCAVIQEDGKIVVTGNSNGVALARYIGVSTPEGGIAVLVDDVEQLVSDGTLNNGQGNALQKNLERALQQLDSGTSIAGQTNARQANVRSAFHKLDSGVSSLQQSITRKSRSPASLQRGDNGKIGAAINQLEAFINKVEVFLDVGILTTAQGRPLANKAQAVIDQLLASSPAKGGPNTSQELLADLPATYALAPNYPNPFNPSTEIGFALPEAGPVRLVIYDVTGREVARLLDGSLQAGLHRVTWRAESLPSGVYLYRIHANEFSDTRRMLLLK